MRLSTRNFTRFYRQVDVDDAAKGPPVREGVRIVYIAEDARETGYTYGGVGSREAAVVGQHGIIVLEAFTPRGILIDGISMGTTIPFGNDEMIQCWTSQALPTLVGPAFMNSPLRGGDDEVLQTTARTATILTANIAVNAFNIQNTVAGQWAPFHVPFGFFFNMAWSFVNETVDMGVRWRELRLYP